MVNIDNRLWSITTFQTANSPVLLLLPSEVTSPVSKVTTSRCGPPRQRLGGTPSFHRQDDLEIPCVRSKVMLSRSCSFEDLQVDVGVPNHHFIVDCRRGEAKGQGPFFYLWIDMDRPILLERLFAPPTPMTAPCGSFAGPWLVCGSVWMVVCR